MPTLADKGKFQFHDKAKDNLTSEMKQWLENDKAIDIILNILKIKFSRTGKENRLYFLRGRTGSGKSTYMIQELYKQLIVGNNTKLFCTQPRVVLTKSNPNELVRYNKDWSFGTNIGVQNGNERIMCSTRDCIYYCTTQIMSNILVELLQETEKERQQRIMKNLKIIVIDECHVLDSPMMALLKNVYDVVNKFGDEAECPLFIFSSATIDLEHMVRYYHNMINNNYNEWLSDPLMIGDVQGTPNYPVIEKFLTSNELNKLNKKEEAMINKQMKSDNKNISRSANEAGFLLFAQYFIDNYAKEIWKSKSTITVDDEIICCRDTLLFVPLFSAIELIGTYLENNMKGKPFFKIGVGCRFNEVQQWRDKNRNKKRILYVGYGRNYATASDEILATSLEKDKESRENEVKIICSTSVIETGKTISTLYLVLNMGIETMSLYNPLCYVPTNSVQYLRQVPINKNQAIQRKGRVGRECPGMFVHFYSKNAYDKFRTIDIAETINNSYLSGLVLNDLSQFNVGIYKDIFNLNNYYYPTSTDILINSARDLVNSGYLTLFGQFVVLKNSIKHSQNWIIYAKFLFYCLGYSLWDSLLLSSLNRKNLPPMMNLYFVSPSSLRYKLEDINDKNINDDMIDSIMRARNTMTSILYGNDETFKCNEERIYKPLNKQNKQNTNNRSIGSSIQQTINQQTINQSNQQTIEIYAFDDWYSELELGRA